MKAAIVPVTPYRQNCSIVWCAETMQGVVIDPGGEVDRLVAAAAANGVAVGKVLLTHGHLDHASGAARLARELGVPIEGPHADDNFLLAALGQNRTQPGFTDAEPCAPSRFVVDGDRVSFGQVTLQVLHCPGHTPGHVVYFDDVSKTAFVGDVLFRGSIGRTDFPRGDHAALIASITGKLWPLGDVRFVPGHGPSSRFAEERRTNPFVRDAVLGNGPASGIPG
ncbi:MAG: MBL fold metallo-hydrolase [Alphaproteobacteria bacterium]|nr:MBL fold metallo-hydrolase [Alphaproteobacteria bacterium]